MSQKNYIQNLLELRPSGFDPKVESHREEDEEIKYGSWEKYEGEHIDERAILPNEIVLDLDDLSTEEARKENKRITEVLKELDIPYFIADSGGKRFHIHIFFQVTDLSKKEYRYARIALFEILKEKFKENNVKVEHLDEGVIRCENNKHLIRCLGGRHRKTERLKTCTGGKIEKQNVEYPENVGYPKEIEVLQISKTGYVDTPFSLEDLKDKLKETQEEEEKERKENYESAYEPKYDGLNNLRKIPPVEVLNSLGKNVQKGKMIKCPGHNDEDPSLQLTEDEKAICWGSCGTPGKPEYKNAIDLVIDIKDCNFREAKGYLIDEFNIETNEANMGWEKVIAKFKNSDTTKLEAIKGAANHLLNKYHFTTLKDNESLWVFTNPVYKREGGQIIKEEIENNLSNFVRKRDVQEMIESIKARTYRERPKQGTNKNLIPLENGLYDIEKDELKEPTPDIFLTNHLPIKYNEDADCPKIKDFLHELVPDDDVPVLQEIIGYGLYRGYPIAKAFMLLGPGKNGKSTFLNLLKRFYGEENIANPSLQELVHNKFAKAELYGKLMNVHGDLSSKTLKKTGNFKMLTGGDLIRGERKYKEPFMFQNHAKLTYSANELPHTYDTTDAFFRRWILIKFPYKFTDNPNDDHKDKNKNILDETTTEEELQGLFNWAIEGLKRILERGKFTKSQAMEKVKDEWLARTNPLDVFIKKHCDIGPDYEVPKKDFLNALNKFCERNGAKKWDKGPLTRKLSKKVGEYFDTSRPRVGDDERFDQKRVRCYRGISVTDEEYGPNVRVVQGFSSTGKRVVHAREDLEEGGNIEKGSLKPPDQVDHPSTRNKGVPSKSEFLNFLEGSEKEEVPKSEVWEKFGEFDELKELIDNLLRDGEIFEPHPDKLKEL